MSESNQSCANFKSSFIESCYLASNIEEESDTIYFYKRESNIQNDEDHLKTDYSFLKIENQRYNSNNVELNGGNSKKLSTAKKRWRILANALSRHSKTDTSDVSIRRFTGFGLLHPSLLSGHWYSYRTNDKKFEIKVHHLCGPFTAQELIGFNNTGNICIWPSEETLALFCLDNLYLFQNKTVLELGGGMSCLAGLMVAKYSEASHTHLTDGNLKSIVNVDAIVKHNRLNDKVLVFPLQWQFVEKTNSVKYDVILVADCLFFEEVRFHLINTIWFSLMQNGTAYIMAPERGHTLSKFIVESEGFGFKCTRIDLYNNCVWIRHQELLMSNSFYDPSLHYPVLVRMTKE